VIGATGTLNANTTKQAIYGHGCKCQKTEEHKKASGVYTMQFIIFLTHAIIGFCVVFFIGAFANANIDITAWDFGCRLAVALFGVIFGVSLGVAGVATHEHFDN
jgi:hypothetical protein